MKGRCARHRRACQERSCNSGPVRFFCLETYRRRGREKAEKKGDIGEWQTVSIHTCQDVPSKTQQQGESQGNHDGEMVRTRIKAFAEEMRNGCLLSMCFLSAEYLLQSLCQVWSPDTTGADLLLLAHVQPEMGRAATIPSALLVSYCCSCCVKSA